MSIQHPPLPVLSPAPLSAPPLDRHPGSRPVFALRQILLAILLLLPLSQQLHAQEEDPGVYEVDRLNTGLSQAKDKVDHSTPRAMMNSFLSLTQDRKFGSAAHLMNLSALKPGEQADEGAKLARELSVVLDRRTWIDFASLPDRPDALVEDKSGDNPMAGKVRRNLLISTLEIGNMAYDIRIARYREPNGSAKWMFTPGTVENVPELYDAFGPRWFEGYLPDWMRQKLGGLWLWEWIGLPLMFLLVGMVGLLIQKGLKRLAGRAEKPYRRRAFASAAMPLALVCSAVLAQALSRLVVSFSGPVTTILSPTLTIVMAIGLGLAALRFVDGVLDHVTRRYIGEISDTRSLKERELYTSIYALRRVIILLTIAASVIVLLMQLNLFQSLGLTLIASAGVLTVVLGIAGQAVLGNILASLQIAIAKPVRIGDTVVYDGEWGYVEAIYYTFIRIRTWDERRLIVPVKHFVSQPTENWSIGEIGIIKRVELLLDQSTDTDLLREAYERLTRDIPEMSDTSQMKMQITGQDDRGITVGFYGAANDPSAAWDLECAMRERLMKFIREEHPDWLPQDRFRAGNETRTAAQAGSQASGTTGEG